MIRRIKKIKLQDVPPESEEGIVDESLPQDEDPEELEEPMNKKIIYGVFALLIVLGVGTGYLLSKMSSIPGTTVKMNTSTNSKSTGVSDTTTFKDSAEGVLQEGGLDGEGTHQLIRDGGPSQTVYLLSSAVDLSQFVGKKVKVWGQTMAAKKAAWLMDVGKVETE